MLQHECIFPDTGESFVIQRDPSVLPPDNATLRMAQYAGRDLLAQSIVAPLYSQTTGNNEYDSSCVHIVDLGSGTGVLGIATAIRAQKLGISVGSLTGVEISDTGAGNTSTNYHSLLGATHPNIQTSVIQASWDDPKTWEQIGNADVIVCNPPYLLPEDTKNIRRGFESVDPRAMCMGSQEELLAMYQGLLARSLTCLRPFGSLYVRLPKYNEIYNDEWAFALERTPEVRESLRALSSQSLASTIRADRYEPFARSREYIGNDTFRHLHVLSANVLPTTYPFMNMFGDPAYAHFLRNGIHVEQQEYEGILKAAGYPNVSGGGFVIGEGTQNFNLPPNHPDYLEPWF